MSSFIILPSAGHSIRYVASPDISYKFSQKSSIYVHRYVGIKKTQVVVFQVLMQQLTLEERPTPTNRVHDAALTLQKGPDVAEGEVVAAVGVLGEHVLELLGQEPALEVIGARVAAVLVLVDFRNIDAEEGVRQPARRRRVREVAVDDKHGDEREQQAKPQFVETGEGVPRPDHAVVVLVGGDVSLPVRNRQMQVLEVYSSLCQRTRNAVAVPFGEGSVSRSTCLGLLFRLTVLSSCCLAQPSSVVPRGFS